MLLVPSDAAAYSYESTVSVGCHERITTDALRAVRASLPNVPRIEPDANEQALIDDLPFHVDEDVRDLAGATLLVAVRDNDLKGRGPLSIDQLAEVHGDPDNQREHCLRTSDEDEPGGSEAALVNCRAFIRERTLDALHGLDANGTPNPDARTSLRVDLAIRGPVDAELPHFYVRMGQALHALEDGFGHTFRTSDGRRVTVVLNFIDVANGVHDERRDGPAHKSALDECEDPDELRTRNRLLATEASTALLAAALDPALDRAAKEAAIDAVLSGVLSYEPGCTFDNGWCDAPEAEYPDGRSCGCVVVGARGGAGSLCLAMLLAAIAAARRKRRTADRSRAFRGARVWLPSLCVLAAFMTPRTLGAQTPAPPPAPPSPTAPAVPAPAPEAAPRGATPEEKAEARAEAQALKPQPPPEADEAPRVVPRGVTVDEAKAEKRERERSIFGVQLAFSASFDNPAIAGGLGLRLQLSKDWALGLDGELNPYYGVQSGKWRTGSFNGFATIIRRFPLRFEAVNLRTTGHVGASVLMMDLYGAPKGSVGPYLGLSPLGIEWKLSRALYVIFDPLNAALPVPQISAAPFAYPQYRSTVGLEIAP
jgi:hypothetical protein